MTGDISLEAPLVVGFGAASQATVNALMKHGFDPTVVDDNPSTEVLAKAKAIGVEVIAAPDAAQLKELVAASTVLLPSPGVGDHHPVFAAAASAAVPVRGEFDLAAMWDSRKIVSITGTNGKTTVTTVVTAALNESGVVAVAAGNLDVPLVEAIEDAEPETFVVEASSFRLGHSHSFSPTVGAWLNFAPDHLDAHSSLEEYRRAKEKIWTQLQPGGIAVANAEDDVVMAATNAASGPVVTFGHSLGDWRWESETLIGPDGPVMEQSQLQLSRPHDLANAAAVGAIATAGGATVSGVVKALSSYRGLAHRNEVVGTFNGVTWVNDSKATVPQATLAAVGGYESIVLIAGGRNKGLPMDSLAEIVPNVKSVVAMGDAAGEVADAVKAVVEVSQVDDLIAAVEKASELAGPGDVVLLSPACTSFDQYSSYVKRGDHFRQLVQEKFS